MNKLRELLNRIIWSPAEKDAKDKYRVTYRDGRTEQEIRLDEITKVESFGFTKLDGSYIPLHRIRSVTKGSETVWRKAGEEPR